MYHTKTGEKRAKAYNCCSSTKTQNQRNRDFRALPGHPCPVSAPQKMIFIGKQTIGLPQGLWPSFENRTGRPAAAPQQQQQQEEDGRVDKYNSSSVCHHQSSWERVGLQQQHNEQQLTNISTNTVDNTIVLAAIAGRGLEQNRIPRKQKIKINNKKI